MNRIIIALYNRMALITILTLSIAGLMILFYFTPAAPAPVQIDPDIPSGMNMTGEKLFKNNCMVCHSIYKTESEIFTTGMEIMKEKGLLYAFIQDPAKAFVESEYLRKLKENYNDEEHPSFPNLSNASIDSIADYVKKFRSR